MKQTYKFEIRQEEPGEKPLRVQARAESLEEAEAKIIGQYNIESKYLRLTSITK